MTNPTPTTTPDAVEKINEADPHPAEDGNPYAARRPGGRKSAGPRQGHRPQPLEALMNPGSWKGGSISRSLL
jgi:hypothetical protein